MSRLLTNLWGRSDWGERTRHQDMNLPNLGGASGIYFIGCGDRIVYIGQSIHISLRPIESLARFYHQIDDITLPWSIGIAIVDDDEVYPFNELESTAIRKFAPIFNTSIPSKLKSQGKEPKIMHIAQVFIDEDKYCTAFELERLEKQAIEVVSNPSPPWHQGNKRRRKWNPITYQYELLEKYKED